MRTQFTKITLIAIATCFSFSTAFAGSFSESCMEEFIYIFKGDDFDIQEFLEELIPVAVKVKAQAKAPALLQFLLGPGPDDKMTDVGITVGCLKALPESSGQIRSLLKDVSLKVAKDVGSKMVKGIVAKRASTKNVYDDDEDDEEEIKSTKPASSSAKVPVKRIDTVKVVILEMEVDAESPELAKEFKPSELRYMTQEVRRTAINYFPKSRYFIIVEQDADFIIKGVIGKFRKNYTIRIEVYDVGNKTLVISSEPVWNEKAEDLLSGFYKIAPDFFKRLEDEVKRIEGGLNSFSKTAPPSAKKDNTGIFTDFRNSKTYITVKMPDGKVWMAENMNYADKASLCYQNNESNCQKCGRLYNWAAAKTICPSGWHLPTHDEWADLEDAIGDYSTAGITLKSKNGWNNIGNGTDRYGFTALPCGYRDGGNFGYWGSSAAFWSATEAAGESAWRRYLYAGFEDVESETGYQSDFYSVRCVQD
jgi:uncharacterized protein (TIGR02145 family)